MVDIDFGIVVEKSCAPIVEPATGNNDLVADGDFLLGDLVKHFGVEREIRLANLEVDEETARDVCCCFGVVNQVKRQPIPTGFYCPRVVKASDNSITTVGRKVT